jgi:hypothetical protein
MLHGTGAAIMLSPATKPLARPRQVSLNVLEAPFGRIDRRIRDDSPQPDALLYACHPRPVNGYSE